MRFVSTRGKEITSFSKAIHQGMAPDGGLYMPERIVSHEPSEFLAFRDRPFHELAHFVLFPYLEAEISEEDCRRICREVFSFPVPLKRLYANTYILELFHGPTFAFKDFGARFLAQCMSHFQREAGREALVLVATSGDTGGAVARGFHKLPGIRVVVFYPRGKVSPLQEKQFTTLGNNILALGVEGVFDDCQALVKSCLRLPELKVKYEVTTANSINIGRLLPQMVYYIYGWLQLPGPERKTVISVPSGNFGNLTAGLMAMYSGLPVEKFVASTNINRVFPDYLETAEYRPRPSLPTLANAMDVGNPNNVERIMSLFSWDHSKISKAIYGSVVDSDGKILDLTKELYDCCGYIADPHSVVGWVGIRTWLDLNSNLRGFFLGTAHPGKFHEHVSKVIRGFEIPEELKELLKRPSKSIPVKNSREEVVEMILGEEYWEMGEK